MSKKYVPSGYQIIDITIDEFGKVVENEDSTLLKEILLTKKLNKPVLLHIVDETNNYKVCGFGTQKQEAITLSFIYGSDNGLYYRFRVDGDELKCDIVDDL